MSNSLSDQLLKAGLVTQNQIDQTEQDKQQRKARVKSQAKDHKSGKSRKPHTARQNQPKPADKVAAAQPVTPAKKPAKKPGSDLAQFYQQRNQLEREERETEERLKREAAAQRKKVRKQLRDLIAENTKNVEDASVRFNFVVGETVKYLYVTEEQQQAIADGELSITFMDGKRCLVAPEIGEQIIALDSSKIVINFKDDEKTDQVDNQINDQSQDSIDPDAGKAADSSES